MLKREISDAFRIDYNGLNNFLSNKTFPFKFPFNDISLKHGFQTAHSDQFRVKCYIEMLLLENVHARIQFNFSYDQYYVMLHWLVML
jgi:hypothetical protein